MTIAQLKKKAKSTREYNSNNAWGFGGKSGVWYTFEELDGKIKEMFIGKFSYRHAPSSNADSFWLGSESVSKKVFLETFK